MASKVEGGSMSSDVILQEQKKRTLEALERRFAVSEAELLQQQQKTSKKRLNEEDEWKHDNMESPFLHHASAKSSSITSYKKGNFAFSGNTKSEGDAELKGPTYWHLSHSVHQNLLGDSNEVTASIFDVKLGRLIFRFFLTIFS